MGLKPLAVGAPLDVVADLGWLGVDEGFSPRPLIGSARLEPGVGGIAMNWVASGPLAVVATAGLPELALLMGLDMILKPRCLLNQTIAKKFWISLEFLTVLSTAKAQVFFLFILFNKNLQTSLLLED
jgi:hypothetical protein